MKESSSAGGDIQAESILIYFIYTFYIHLIFLAFWWIPDKTPLSVSVYILMFRCGSTQCLPSRSRKESRRWGDKILSQLHEEDDVNDSVTRGGLELCTPGSYNYHGSWRCSNFGFHEWPHSPAYPGPASSSLIHMVGWWPISFLWRVWSRGVNGECFMVPVTVRLISHERHYNVCFNLKP